MNPMANNIIATRGPGFYVSYVEQRTEVGAYIDELMAKIVGPGQGYGEPETALCIKDKGKAPSGNLYLILRGDHREQYAKLAPDLTACLDYFKSNIEQIHWMSDSLEGVN